MRKKIAAAVLGLAAALAAMVGLAGPAAAAGGTSDNVCNDYYTGTGVSMTVYDNYRGYATLRPGWCTRQSLGWTDVDSYYFRSGYMAHAKFPGISANQYQRGGVWWTVPNNDPYGNPAWVVSIYYYA